MLSLGLFGVLHLLPGFCSRWGCSVEEFAFLAKFGCTSLGVPFQSGASIVNFLTGENPGEYGLDISGSAAHTRCLPVLCGYCGGIVKSLSLSMWPAQQVIGSGEGTIIIKRQHNLGICRSGATPFSSSLELPLTHIFYFCFALACFVVVLRPRPHGVPPWVVS